MATSARIYDRRLLEAGEDEEPKEDEETSSSNAEDEETSDDESKDSDAEVQDAVDDIDKPFSGLDLRRAHCFGLSSSSRQGWKAIADQIEDVGKSLVDIPQLEKSLAQDVEKSYFYIAQFKLVNVDDGMSYSLKFDNNKVLWQVEISNSPKAELSIEERADFFKSEMFQSIAKKTYYRLLDAQKTFNKNVKGLFENGELLLVDAVKLEAILSFLDKEYFLKNLLSGKYLGY